MKKNTSVIEQRFHLEIGLGKKSVYRYCQSLLKKLVLNPRRNCHKIRKFTKIRGKITYEAGTGLIYHLNPQCRQLECYNAYDWKRKVTPIYSMPVTPCHVVSVWQQSTYSTHIRKGHRASIFLLMKNGYLLRNDMQTGVLLEEIFLPPQHRFVEMIEDRETGYIYVKSTHFGKSKSDMIAAVVVFSFPHLEFVGFFEATKSIFGESAVNLEISQGILLILHSNHIVKLYNLVDILTEFTVTNFKLGDIFQCHSVSCEVGKYPCGLPLNVIIPETPPVLLEIKTKRHRLQIGGQPWHCIVCPSERNFQICRLSDLQVVRNGLLQESDELDDDLVVFHPDETLKVIHVTSSSLTIYKVVAESGPQLQKFYSLDAYQTDDLEGEQETRRSSFGRRIFQKKFFETYPSAITFDYEDELEIFAILVVRDAEEDKGPRLEVILQDSASGKILRTISLPECYWPVIDDSHFSFEIDGLLLTVNAKCNNKSKMVMYILSEDE